MARGLYQRRKAGKDGKLRNVGAFVLEKRIPNVPEFAGIPKRIAKSTGVFRGDRNAEEIVRGMKLMLKELIRERDAKLLRKVQDGTLSLPSLYKSWREGRTHLAGEFVDRKVAREWLKYIAESALAEKTKVNRKAIVTALLKKGLLSEETVVNELPQRLKAIRKHYEARKQAPAYNTIRIELGAFLTKGLGMDSDSEFYRELMRVQPLKQGPRREHHPLVTPRECADFCAEVARRPSPSSAEYVESVLFVCRHGLRPEEFERRLFAVDSETGHLRVKGTKNPNAHRLVPLVMQLPTFDPPKVDTLNRLFERMGSNVRCRDFRRTYTIWCQAAGLPENRIRAYAGHAPQTQTQHYQKVTSRQALLDADRKALVEWYAGEMRKAPPEKTKTKLPSGFQERFRALSPSFETLRAAALRDSESRKLRKR